MLPRSAENINFCVQKFWSFKIRNTASRFRWQKHFHEIKFTDCVHQTKHSVLEFWSYLFPYDNAKEKAALHLSEFSTMIPKTLACSFSLGLRDSCASFQHFQGGEEEGKTSFLKHRKGWQARRRTGGAILHAYLYALQTLSCRFPCASCLKRQLKWSEASCARPGKGIPARILCPDVRHKR